MFMYNAGYTNSTNRCALLNLILKFLKIKTLYHLRPSIYKYLFMSIVGYSTLWVQMLIIFHQIAIKSMK